MVGLVGVAEAAVPDFDPVVDVPLRSVEPDIEAPNGLSTSPDPDPNDASPPASLDIDNELNGSPISPTGLGVAKLGAAELRLLLLLPPFSLFSAFPPVGDANRLRVLRKVLFLLGGGVGKVSGLIGRVGILIDASRWE